MKALDKCVLLSVAAVVILYTIFSFRATDVTNTSQKVISSLSQSLSQSLSHNQHEHVHPVYNASEALRRRAIRVSHVCSKYSEFSSYIPKRNEGIPVYKYTAYLKNEQRSLLYCPVPKCGWTSWRTMFFQVLYKGTEDLNGILTDPARTGWLTPWEQIGMTKHSLLEGGNVSSAKLNSKMIFVRDPYDRLVSAYKDKAVRDNGIYTKREKTPCEWIKHDSPVLTFSQFVDCIIKNAQTQSKDKLDSFRAGELLDMHWRPQYLLCNVCLINFNIVGHFDHMNDDIGEALRLLDMNIKPSWGNVGGSRKPLSRYYKQLTELQLNQLQLLYKYDFEIFDFNKTSYTDL